MTTTAPRAPSMTNESDGVLRLTTLAAAVVAAATNKREHLQTAIRNGFERGIVTEREFYEAILQTYLFAGFPAALEGLLVLAEVAQKQFGKSCATTFQQNDREYSRRGEALCEQIYTSAYHKMRTNLASVSPDLAEWMIVEGYGKTLSRAGLDAPTRELLVVAVLAALGWEKQLYSHLRGSLNVGASEHQCRLVLSVLETLDDATNKVMLRKHRHTAEATLDALMQASAEKAAVVQAAAQKN